MRAAWWWIDRWRKSTAFMCMNMEQQGLYRNLLDSLWLFDSHEIPDEPRALVMASGGDPEAWTRSGATVLKWMTRTKTGWTHETAMEVIEKSKAISESRSEAGRRGNAVRWAGNRKAIAKAIADDTANVIANASSPSPSPSPEQSPNKRKRIKPSASASRRTEGHETWLTPYGAAWRERWGQESEPPFGAMTVFRKHEESIGAEELIGRWTRYLASKKAPKESRPMWFVQELGQWKALEPRKPVVPAFLTEEGKKREREARIRDGYPVDPPETEDEVRRLRPVAV